MKSLVISRLAIVAILATMLTGLAMTSPAPAHATPVPGPTWVEPTNGQTITLHNTQLTLEVRPNPQSGNDYNTSVPGGVYLFGLFKIAKDGNRIPLYENWSKERHLSPTTWTLAPGSDGLKTLQEQQGDWTLELWARAYMGGGNNSPYWTDPSITEIHVTQGDQPEPVDTSNYSGYSMSPANGAHVYQVDATWRVPEVTCPSPVQVTRAAVWVGMWGTMAAFKSNTEVWLPQIGTSSRCNAGEAHYEAVWALQGAEELWRKFLPGLFPGGPSVIAGFDIRPGDVVHASVTYAGHDSAGDAKFNISITDDRTGRTSAGPIVTPKPATLDQVAGQGGAIVEPEKDGLAEFHPPIGITGFYMTAGADGRYTGIWHVYEYRLTQPPSAHLLASNSALSSEGFTVTWLPPKQTSPPAGQAPTPQPSGLISLDQAKSIVREYKDKSTGPGHYEPYLEGDPARWDTTQIRVLIGQLTPGDSYTNRAFFFSKARFLGTDTSEPSARMSVLAQDTATITIQYELYRNGDALVQPTGGTANVRFFWNGAKLVPLDPIPPCENPNRSSLSRC